MNRILFTLVIIFSLLFLGACTSDDSFIESASSTKGEVTRVEAITLPFDDSNGFSRTTTIIGSDYVVNPVWAKGDTIGIYPSAGGDQLSFPITDGVGKSTCTFTGGGWALKNSTATTTYAYTAYTPFNRNYYLKKDNTALPFSMLGQKQKGNNNSDHLGAYHLQIANGDTPENGIISFKFKHKITFVRMDITAPCEANWKSITLNSTADFTTEASMNLSLATPTVTPTEQSNSVTLELENVSTTDSLHIVAYMMMLPVDFTDKTISMDLTDTEGNVYTAPVSIDNPTNVANPLIFGPANARWISAKFDIIPYVTFSANAEQTLTMSQAVKNLEYSVDGGEWSELGTNTVTFGGKNGNLQLRGENENGTVLVGNNTTLYNSPKIIFGNSTLVACYGDIRTLIDYEDYSTAYTGNASFCGLFKGCNNLILAPKLPATTLGKSCYDGMFDGCSSLTSAPELPATTLAPYCYSDMFYGCSSLTSTPKLPAKTLDKGCYSGMFWGCSSLIDAPELPAVTLADGCYSNMFNSCYNLVSAPELPAVTLAYDCYSNMFFSCFNLVSAPELPATTMTDNCYGGMFNGCSSLIDAPELPATTLAKYCYSNMFNSCYNLVSAPELPATTLTENCYSGMFSCCFNLVSAPKLPANTLVEGCYASMFRDCYHLKKITMLATNINEYLVIHPLDKCVAGVANTGTFTKAKEMESLPINICGIPEGWTIVDYEE